MADAPDSKSGGVNPREGSSPSSGTNHVPRHFDGKRHQTGAVVNGEA